MNRRACMGTLAALVLKQAGTSACWRVLLQPQLASNDRAVHEQKYNANIHADKQTYRHKGSRYRHTSIPTDRRHPLIHTMGGQAGRRPEGR